MGTLTHMATFFPSLSPGMNTQFFTAATAARSRTRYPLEVRIRSSATRPARSILASRTTVPSYPRLLAIRGYGGLGLDPYLGVAMRITGGAVTAVGAVTDVTGNDASGVRTGPGGSGTRLSSPPVGEKGTATGGTAAAFIGAGGAGGVTARFLICGFRVCLFFFTGIFFLFFFRGTAFLTGGAIAARTTGRGAGGATGRDGKRGFGR